MPSPLSPFLNNVASAGQFQAAGTELGRSRIVFGDLEAAAVREEVTPSRVGAGALLGLGLWGCGWQSPRAARFQSLLTEQLLFSLNLPPRAEAAHRR